MAKRMGDFRKAIMRFNQSWLLDPGYYQSYWGFGSVMLSEKRPEKAIVYFDRAIKLIDEESQKPRLLVDAARAYGWSANLLKEDNPEESKRLYERANRLIVEAMEIDPIYQSSYNIGAILAFDQGDYELAWDFVKKSKANGIRFSDEFIDRLAKKMPEPK